MVSELLSGPSTVGELLSGAREPTPARPVLMRMLWAGEGLVDVMLPIDEDSRVRPRGGRGCDGTGPALGGWYSAGDRWSGGVREFGGIAPRWAGSPLLASGSGSC